MTVSLWMGLGCVILASWVVYLAATDKTAADRKRATLIAVLAVFAFAVSGLFIIILRHT